MKDGKECENVVLTALQTGYGLIDTASAYRNELIGGKGTIFATGTSVSNSMTKLYTLMRYLQHGMLRQKGLTHFDQWASTFGEITTAIDVACQL